MITEALTFIFGKPTKFVQKRVSRVIGFDELPCQDVQIIVRISIGAVQNSVCQCKSFYAFRHSRPFFLSLSGRALERKAHEATKVQLVVT